MTDAVQIDRRAMMLGAAAAAVTTTIGRARAAARFTYKFSTNVPLSHPLNIRLQQAFDLVAQESGGIVDLQLFPNSELGGDTDVLAQLRSGAVEFQALSTGILSTLVPVSSICGIGFAMPDYDTVWRAMDGDLGAHIRSEIAKANIVPMEHIWDLGFRHMTTRTKPILTPDDLRDLKMRVPASPLWTSMFRAFGSAPVTINANELYSALQSRIAEGQENPLTPIRDLKIYEVQKYLALTGHMWDGWWLLANRQAWDALPAELQDLTARRLNQSALEQRADLADLNTNLRPALEAQGMVFNKVDKSAFRERLARAGFYTEWRSRYGDAAWALLEKYSGPLA
jgi:tripartite ATP-independent transporter DctP family solute receptor